MKVSKLAAKSCLDETKESHLLFTAAVDDTLLLFDPQCYGSIQWVHGIGGRNARHY